MILRALLLAAALAAPAVAQDAPAPATGADAATLADLRASLGTLASALQALRAELKASGAAGFEAAGGDSAIDRMDAIEAEIARLTGRTEQLQNRIQRIVTDGTRRLDDIEFRLCEIDPACDLGALMSQPELGSLGAAAAPGTPAAPAAEPASGAAPAGQPAQPATAAEQADFDRAREVLGQGDFRRAAELFAAVAETHAGGALTAEALFLRGSALDSAGEPAGAASAWLEAFAASPDGPRAADSLLGLSRVLAEGEDPPAACLYLAEIPARFPGSEAAAEAQRRTEALGCAADAAAIDPEAAADLDEPG